MISYWFRGILIGIVFGVPAGALGALVIQRTLEHGPAAGLITGLGSTIADTLYACLCVLGSSLISGVLNKYEVPITVFGGCIVLGLGIYTVRKQGMRVNDGTKTFWKDLTSGFAIAIMNPGLILLFLFACSILHTQGPYSHGQAYPMLVGVSMGCYLWWIIIVSAMTALRKHITDRIYTTLNKVLGTILVIFGIGVIISAFVRF